MLVNLVINPVAASGKAAGRVGAAIAHLRSHDCDVELLLPTSEADARAKMAALAEEGAERVVVLGGDGMVHQAANALAGSETVLGIISGGTGNDAAVTLGLPGNLEDACASALESATPIDLIKTDHGYAVTVATVGFSVAANDRADAMRFPRGAARYTIAALVELPKLEAHSLMLTLDGVASDVQANLIAVGNLSSFGGGMKVAPDADPRDGLLDVVVIGPAGRALFTGLLPTVFRGRHIKNKRVSVQRAERVEIAGSDLHMRADGERFGRLPTTITVAAGALRVAGVSL